MTKAKSLNISYSNSVVLSCNDNPNQMAKDLCTSTEAHLVMPTHPLTIERTCLGMSNKKGVKCNIYTLIMIDQTNDYHTLAIIHNTLSCGLKSYHI